MIIYVVVSYEEFDSIWSTPELALERMEHLQMEDYSCDVVMEMVDNPDYAGYSFSSREDFQRLREQGLL